jgi:hypothetical protein
MKITARRMTFPRTIIIISGQNYGVRHYAPSLLSKRNSQRSQLGFGLLKTRRCSEES